MMKRLMLIGLMGITMCMVGCSNKAENTNIEKNNTPEVTNIDKNSTPEVTNSDNSSIPETSTEPPVNKDGKKQLTMNIVKELAKKGNNLMMEDFYEYIGTDIGSGMFIMVYPIDEEYQLIMNSGSLKGKPMNATLERVGTEERIDIRTESIDDFLEKK